MSNRNYNVTKTMISWMWTRTLQRFSLLLRYENMRPMIGVNLQNSTEKISYDSQATTCPNYSWFGCEWDRIRLMLPSYMLGKLGTHLYLHDQEQSWWILFKAWSLTYTLIDLFRLWSLTTFQSDSDLPRDRGNVQHWIIMVLNYA